MKKPWTKPELRSPRNPLLASIIRDSRVADKHQFDAILARAYLSKSEVGKRVRVLKPDPNSPAEGVFTRVHPHHSGCFLVKFHDCDVECAVFPEHLELI